MPTPAMTSNPMLATSVTGSFGVTWNGLISGMAMPDPAVRYYLAGGWLANSETLPMWGGLLISENVPSPQASPPLTPSQSLGGPVIRATNVLGAGNDGNATGFSVFNQDYAAINNPQSEVPIIPSYGSVNFFRFGSGARIAVPAASSLSSLAAHPITAQVSWDYVNQQLVPYQAAFGANTITAGSWSLGVASLTTNSPHGISPGGVFTISNVDPTGYNGTFVAAAGTTGSTLNYALAANPGSYNSAGNLAAGGGALNCRVLKLEFGNSMVPVYSTVTGFCNWNRSGNAALILI